MAYNPDILHRRSLRLKEYDYSQAGAYFVTVCTQGRACLFGDISDGHMVLNDAGRMVERCWKDIPAHFPHVELDAFVVMPNHVHGILSIIETVAANAVGAKNFSPLRSMPQGTSKTIGSVIRGFKIGATKWFRQHTATHDVWQRNYYEHVIRNDGEMNSIREYIQNNPLQWDLDRDNPYVVGVFREAPLQKDEPWRI